MDIEFEVITGNDGQIGVLYDLLSRRTHSISHVQMPSYVQHSEFVRGHPYLCWYLIKAGGEYIGSFYITEHNSVGINIIDDWIEEGVPSVIERVRLDCVPLPAIRSTRGAFFCVNVAPGNVKLIDALERNGCVLAQLGYLIR